MDNHYHTYQETLLEFHLFQLGDNKYNMFHKHQLFHLFKHQFNLYHNQLFNNLLFNKHHNQHQHLNTFHIKENMLIMNK